MEYVEREIAKKAFQDIDAGRRDGWTTSLSSEEAADYLAEYLDEIPVADVAPVKRGHWAKDIGGCRVTCTNCGRDFDMHFEIRPAIVMKFKYCPDCGAKMDGDN